MESHEARLRDEIGEAVSQVKQLKELMMLVSIEGFSRGRSPAPDHRSGR